MKNSYCTGEAGEAAAAEAIAQMEANMASRAADSAAAEARTSITVLLFAPDLILHMCLWSLFLVHVLAYAHQCCVTWLEAGRVCYGHCIVCAAKLVMFLGKGLSTCAGLAECPRGVASSKLLSL